MIPYILIAVGGYLIGQSRTAGGKRKFAYGGEIDSWEDYDLSLSKFDVIKVKGQNYILKKIQSSEYGNKLYFVGIDDSNMGKGKYLLQDYSGSNLEIKDYADGGEVSDGGSIPNNYEGKTAKEVWDSWNYEQKFHFLTDHKSDKSNPLDFRLNDLSDIANHSSYDELPKNIKLAISDHLSWGQYAKGGTMADGGKVYNWKKGTTTKFKTRKDAQHHLDLMKNNNESGTSFQNLKVEKVSDGWVVKFDFNEKYAKGGTMADGGELGRYKIIFGNGLVQYVHANNLMDAKRKSKLAADIYGTDVKSLDKVSEIQDSEKNRIIGKRIMRKMGMMAAGGDIANQVQKLLNGLKSAPNEDVFDEISNKIHAISDNEGLSEKEYEEWDKLRSEENKKRIDKYFKKAATGGKLKSKKKPKKWIQDALSGDHKGALRETAKRKGLLRGDENLSKTDLKKLEKMGGKTAKRAYMAETLSKFEDGGDVKKVTDGEDTFYLTYIDSTHFFLSNTPEHKGNAYHIGQFKSRPFYNEVDTWLKTKNKK